MEASDELPWNALANLQAYKWAQTPTPLLMLPQEHQGLEVMVQAHVLQQLLEAQAHSSLVSDLKALHLFNLIVFL